MAASPASGAVSEVGAVYAAGARMRVFVYGSLMAGEENHEVMAGAQWVGEAQTAPRYELVDLGSYPGLIAGGATRVRGELYEVDDALLARLDAFEGHPRFYRRCAIELEGGERAQGYTLGAKRYSARPRIAGGDWRAHRAARR